MSKLVANSSVFLSATYRGGSGSNLTRKASIPTATTMEADTVNKSVASIKIKVVMGSITGHPAAQYNTFADDPNALPAANHFRLATQ
jgi:hypothetical protein